MWVEKPITDRPPKGPPPSPMKPIVVKPDIQITIIVKIQQ